LKIFDIADLVLMGLKLVPVYLSDRNLPHCEPVSGIEMAYHDHYLRLIIAQGTLDFDQLDWLEIVAPQVKHGVLLELENELPALCHSLLLLLV